MIRINEMKDGETRRICWIAGAVKEAFQAAGIYTGSKLTRICEKGNSIIVKVNGKETALPLNTETLGVHTI